MVSYLFNDTQKIMVLLNQMEEVIILLNQKQEITGFNRKAEKIFECTQEEARQVSISRIIPDIGEQIPGFSQHSLWTEKDFARTFPLHGRSLRNTPLNLLGSMGKWKRIEYDEFFLIINPNPSWKKKNSLACLSQETLERMVALMQLSVRIYEASTGEDRVDLAEKSQAWSISPDYHGPRARTFPKYLHYNQIPRSKPNWQAVLKTADYVLKNCPFSSLQKEKEEMLKEKTHLEKLLLCQGKSL